MNTLWNIQSIWKHSFRLLLIVVLSAFATKVASAKTISSSTTIDGTLLSYFENIYKREDYKNYVLSAEYISNSGYSYTTSYYLCLTNNEINVTDTNNIVVNCDKLYQYYRSNSVYYSDSLEDKELNIINSIYYSNNFLDKSFILEKFIILLNIGLFCFFLVFVLLKVFGG